MKTLLRIILILSVHSVIAQPYGNEWIDYSQSYYKFKVSEDGLYRIDYQTLINSSVPLSSINPQSIQIFARGVEIPIYIEGESDGVFNPGDFIEFYANKNDGWIDSVFYKGRGNQPNPYYSLINDTINYYLTWQTSGSGKRIQSESATDFGNYFTAPYVMKESLLSFNTSYYDGEILPSQATDPEYVPSEGWMSTVLTLGLSKNLNLPVPNRYASGPFVDFEIKVAGQSDWRGQNNGDHHLRIEYGNQVIDTIFEGYEVLTLRRSFSPSELQAGNNTLRILSIDDRNSAVDRTAISYAKAFYPQTLSFSNQREYDFWVEDHASQNKQFLEIRFFQGGSNPILYDITNGKRILTVQGLSDYKTLIPNAGGLKHCYIAAQSEIKSVGELLPVSSTAKFIDYKTQLVDTFVMFVTHASLLSEVSTYASYRRNNGREVLISDIDQLYHQYGYGIEKNPLAIRNFIEVATDSWSFPPSHLFLIGKSVAAKQHRKDASGFSENLVPTFGNPAADNLLTAGLNQSNLEPLIPQGRLSAVLPSDVDAYLDKVIEYESAEQDLWMKSALHFAGGKQAFEAAQLEAYLNGFAQTYRNEPRGGEIKTFRKSSSAPFQTSLSDSIRILINGGTGLMTFFGHSSATGNFDISIDSPDRLQNRGKYPLILANSCYAGNYHQAGLRSTGEKYVLERNKGSIGFIANGNLGLATTLNDYSSVLYQYFNNKGYGNTIAENIRQTVIELQQGNVYPTLKSICIEMSLQGDPCVSMNAPQFPDYLIEAGDLSVQPSEVTTDLDSFTIQFNVSNIAKAVSDSLVVEIRQSYPVQTLSDTSYFLKVSPVLYQSNLSVTLPIDINRNVGRNQFTIILDPLNELQELSEFNNRFDFEVLVRSGEIIPVSPPNYAIVGSQSVSLKASTAFAFEGEKTYRFELDTAYTFNSPFLQNIEINSVGGVVQWSPSVLSNMPDSTVFYWRVSPVPQANDPYNWKSSSFQYVPNQTGWAQSDFGQYKNNRFLFINPNPSSRQLDYVQSARELEVVNQGDPRNGQELNEIKYSIDADVRETGACRVEKGFLIAVLDSLTLESWKTPYNGNHTQNDFGQANKDSYCEPYRYRSENYFLFRADQASEMLAMRDFLNQRIPDGHYVVFYNWLPVDYSAIWAQDSSILRALENLGSSEIRNVPDKYPFIFTVKKGDISTVQEVSGDSLRHKISIRRSLIVNSTFGDQTTVDIGPSSNWERLAYQFQSLESNSADSLIVELIGINQNGGEQNLFSSNSFSLDTSLQYIVNFNTYPSLKLKARSFDDQLRTPPQLKYWLLKYKSVPDLAINPAAYFQLDSDSLQEGEPLKFEFVIENVSQESIDSFPISFNVLSSQNQLTPIKFDTLPPLGADSQYIYQAEIPTNGFRGKYKLIVEVNADRNLSELNYFNNRGQFDFVVVKDLLNPNLDVTFDGKRILNREIVSSEPVIRVQLSDDNEFLALNDTSTLALYLRKPNGQEVLLNYQNSAEYLQFVPANLPENEAQVIYRPIFTEDGIYRLRVQAKDVSGNTSGRDDYQIEFEVLTKSTVTHLMNYPNPFSTSTKFVFTLTGSRVPDQVQIQIMTVTGKVVKEIDQYELGPLRIGNNITEYAWDGKDEFGDQLANGVYLYRVKMKIDGQNIEHRESAADQFFKESFGKMYLLR